MEILRKNDSLEKILPVDPRTVRSRAETVGSFFVEHDDFVYIGIKHHLENYFSQEMTSIILNFSTDGLPLGPSTSRRFWPVLMSWQGFDNLVFVISVTFFDNAERSVPVCSITRYLIPEIKQLVESGFRGIPVHIGHVTGDLPAMALLMQIRGHSGYFSCYKCNIEGQYLGLVGLKHAF